MKKTGLLFLSLLVSVILIAQKQINDPNAQVRSVNGFHAIKVSNGIELLLNQGSTEAVAVSATDTEHRDRIKTVVENGVLKIFYDQNFLKQLRNRGNKKLKAYVSFVNIDGLDLSSGSIVKVDGEIKGSKLDFEASSGSIFNGKVSVGQLEVDQSSGSVVNMSGTASNLEIEGSSGSIFNGYDLVTENCVAETSSGSGVQITVNKELTAEASSGGYVSYKGAGVIRKTHTSSGGNVSKKG